MDIKAIVGALSKEEKQELFNFLKKEMTLVPDIESIKNRINIDQAIICPHCNSTDIYGHGLYKGRKRYKCKSCKISFNDLTGTAISGIKKVDKFQEYIQIIIESLTIREAAKRLDVSVPTAFKWRHKLLASISPMNGQSFTGIVECDDKQIDISEKGNKELERDAYKRPSDRIKKRGVSNDKVSIMVASDRHQNFTMKVAKIGRIDELSVDETIGSLIDKKNVLCSDSHPSIIAWSKSHNIEHHTFVATRQHIKDKCYHVQHVNSIDSIYEKWIRKFNGISTKYLPQYLNWFVMLRKLKTSSSPILEIARTLSINVSALYDFRSIEDEYQKLLIPQTC